jgi:iron-sulfur cluster assembly protein iscA
MTMIILSTAAAAHVKKCLLDRGKGVGIRIGVRTSGCSGLAYTLEYVDDPKKDDQIFQSEGVHIFVDPKSLVYLDGMQLDYQHSGLQSSFVFNNPNSKGDCGCGESFYV